MIYADLTRTHRTCCHKPNYWTNRKLWSHGSTRWNSSESAKLLKLIHHGCLKTFYDKQFNSRWSVSLKTTNGNIKEVSVEKSGELAITHHVWIMDIWTKSLPIQLRVAEICQFEPNRKTGHPTNIALRAFPLLVWLKKLFFTPQIRLSPHLIPLL